MESRDDLEQELDVVMQKAGLLIPPDRKAGVVAAYVQLKHHLSMVRETLASPREASSVWHPDAFSRSQ